MAGWGCFDSQNGSLICDWEKSFSDGITYKWSNVQDCGFNFTLKIKMGLLVFGLSKTCTGPCHTFCVRILCQNCCLSVGFLIHNDE